MRVGKGRLFIWGHRLGYNRPVKLDIADDDLLLPIRALEY
jgi:hypothetical protein